jgi:hypothetical protein
MHYNILRIVNTRTAGSKDSNDNAVYKVVTKGSMLPKWNSGAVNSDPETELLRMSQGRSPHSAT